MQKVIRYFGCITYGLLLIGTAIGVFQGTMHPLAALFTPGGMYLLFAGCRFAIRFLFWYDELRQEFNRKAGERIVPRERLTWQLLTCWHGSTPQATRWRRRYNFMAIFATLMCCSILIYGVLIYLALGLIGGSSSGSKSSGSSDGSNEIPWQYRGRHNCRWGYSTAANLPAEAIPREGAAPVRAGNNGIKNDRE